MKKVWILGLAAVGLMIAVMPAMRAQTGGTLPQVRLVDPTNGETITGTCYVSFDAFSAIGLARFDLIVDGKVISTLTTSKNRPPYIFKWRTYKGMHQYTVRATDFAGNYYAPPPFTVYCQ